MNSLTGRKREPWPSPIINARWQSSGGCSNASSPAGCILLGARPRSRRPESRVTRCSAGSVGGRPYSSAKGLGTKFFHHHRIEARGLHQKAQQTIAPDFWIVIVPPSWQSPSLHPYGAGHFRYEWRG